MSNILAIIETAPVMDAAPAWSQVPAWTRAACSARNAIVYPRYLQFIVGCETLIFVVLTPSATYNIYLTTMGGRIKSTTEHVYHGRLGEGVYRLVNKW